VLFRELYPFCCFRVALPQESNFAESQPVNRFGPEVMDTVVSWTRSLCIDISRRRMLNHGDGDKVEHSELGHDLSSWSVLDLGTGNGLLLQELAKLGYLFNTVNLLSLA